MHWNKKRWALRYFKVGMLPGLHFFVRAEDLKRLAAGQHMQIRMNDGTTKPDWQHDIGVVIDELRLLGDGESILIVAHRL